MSFKSRRRFLAITRALISIGVGASLSGCQPDMFAEAKQAVREQVGGSDSTRFGQVVSCGSSDIVRGTVSAPSSRGEHASYQPFYYANGLAEIGKSALLGGLHKQCMAAIRAKNDEVLRSLPKEQRDEAIAELRKAGARMSEKR